jgi:predicted TIM-barrel fold metal-dependent hydrolase
MPICDAHCHFFSTRFFELLTKDLPDLPVSNRAGAVCERLQWDDPGTPEALAARWVQEMDRAGVSRAVMMASIPGDEDSVATAVQLHSTRFVGFFLFNPTAPDGQAWLERALSELKLRGVALFPAMHRYSMDHEQVDATFRTAAAHGAAVFVHCGFLSVGVRKKLGLPSPFDLRLGDPLAVAAVAVKHPRVPVIIPHFGAGFFSEALMAADQAPNIVLDSSSSNSWMRYHPRLTLDAVFRQALEVAGPDRIIFGSDSSFFPRGWNRPVYEAQRAALAAVGADDDSVDRIMCRNFERLFQ